MQPSAGLQETRVPRWRCPRNEAKRARGFVPAVRRAIAHPQAASAELDERPARRGQTRPALLHLMGCVTTLLSRQSHRPASRREYLFVKDHLGSPRLVVNTSNGALAQRLDYDEWGVVTNDTNAAFQPFGFAGGLYDRDTQLVRFGARDYDVSVNRWTTKDTLRFGGGPNFFVFSSNDPMNRIDPTGLTGEEICEGLLGCTGPGAPDDEGLPPGGGPAPPMEPPAPPPSQPRPAPCPDDATPDGESARRVGHVFDDSLGWVTCCGTISIRKRRSCKGQALSIATERGTWCNWRFTD